MFSDRQNITRTHQSFPSCHILMSLGFPQLRVCAITVLLSGLFCWTLEDAPRGFHDGGMSSVDEKQQEQQQQ